MPHLVAIKSRAWPRLLLGGCRSFDLNDESDIQQTNPVAFVRIDNENAPVRGKTGKISRGDGAGTVG